ncbi:AAA family ATPase [Patescibacteria group bacterium]|nr:AAA family ATPase [Patescibacteria group bacterium]MBU4580489.1 AAA family ATPase [Patescibacteria group bacterium]
MQNMKVSLIEFSVENFKIFKNKATFSMLTRKGEHAFDSNGENLLKTSLIYGPNASGKSTLLSAFIILKTGIIYSANNPENADLPYIPFVLSDKSGQPSFFEVIFSIDEQIFKYSLSILKEKIVAENLFEILSNGKEKQYLIRNEHSIKVFNDFTESEDIKTKTRKEVLFLSAAAQWNNPLAIKIVDGFENINIISGGGNGAYRGYTVKLVKENMEAREKIITFLQKADFSIETVEVKETIIPKPIEKQTVFPDKKDGFETMDIVFFSHSKFDSKNNKIGLERFNMGDESVGTQKFFDALGPIIDTIENGKVLLIDEFDNSLHPLLTKFIVDIFEKNNPNNAQLIVTTHDTSLISHKNDFIKDQIWFTEKDKYGSGNLFSLSEINDDIRNDTEFSKKYLEGRFGALPFIESI